MRLVEDYRKRTVQENELPTDQKMIILWDVYCRHRDEDLLALIRDEYPNIILLFVPANLPEICQPLDIYFNAEFKVTLANLRNKRIAEEFEAWRQNKSLTDGNEDLFTVDNSLAANNNGFTKIY